MTVLAWILLVAALGALAFYGLGIVCTLRHLGEEPARYDPAELPSISLLKPIKGLEESLEDNLRTFFEQDYPAGFEIVFAATEPDDPGIALARRVAADYPEVPVQFVRSDPDFGLNPKVSNLAGALEAARHDLVLQSDANVRVRGDFLQRVAGEMHAKEGSLLSCVVVGSGERSAAAAMENLQLSSFTAPAVCAALKLAGRPVVLGKSMLLRKSELDALGGIEQVRDILCEDFILGDRYRKAGKNVILSSTTVHNHNEHLSVERFLARHSRWLKMRVVIHVGAFVGDLGANPVALGVAALAASGFNGPMALTVGSIAGVKMVGDGFVMRATRGASMRPAYLLLSPLKDTLMGGVWLYSCFSRTVKWRGKRLRFGSRSKLRPDEGALPVRLAKRLLR